MICFVRCFSRLFTFCCYCTLFIWFVCNAGRKYFELNKTQKKANCIRKYIQMERSISQCIELPCYKIACSKYIKVILVEVRSVAFAAIFITLIPIHSTREKRMEKNLARTHEDSKSNRPFGHCELQLVQNECTKYRRIHIINIKVCVCVFFHTFWCALFSYLLFIFFVSTHKKRERQMRTILRATNQTIITIFFSFIILFSVVIGRIQGRCECTYIRKTHQANNTLTENQNEQIASCKQKKKIKERRKWM